MNILHSLMNDRKRDIGLIPISDTHSGSTKALFPSYKVLQNGYWKFKNSKYTPNGRQVDLYDHWIFSAGEASKQLEGKRKIVVLDGDAIEGIHHYSTQIVSPLIDEHVDVHIFLMEQFLKELKFNKNNGDLLYYVQGTEVHTEDKESRIAKELGAELVFGGDDNDLDHAPDFLSLELNGKLVWFIHQGAAPGKGVNEGESLRLWMKHQYFDRLEHRERLPDLIISGHYHRNVYNTFVRDYHTMHGLILSPWQLKTRFANKRAAAERDGIGLSIVDIKASGEIKVHKPLLLKNRDNITVVT